MKEQLTLDEAEQDEEVLNTINDIIGFVSKEMNYDLKYFSVDPNYKNKGKKNEELIGYSLSLDNNLFAKANVNLTEITVKNAYLCDNIPGEIARAEIKAPKGSTKITFSETSLGKDYLKSVALKFTQTYIPSYRFGCCNLYEKCSDARKCIAKDNFHAKGCFYRENLEKGLIFYGKNAKQ